MVFDFLRFYASTLSMNTSEWSSANSTICLEYHSVYPLVRIGTHTPCPSCDCVPPPPGTKREGTHSRGVRGGSYFGRLEKKPSTLSTLWSAVIWYRYHSVWYGMQVWA
jgi:hypothetical protein